MGSTSGVDSSLSSNGEGGTQHARPRTLTLNTANIVNLATRNPPSSSSLPTSSPGGAPATGPRVVRGYTWQGGGPAAADKEAGEP